MLVRVPAHFQITPLVTEPSSRNAEKLPYCTEGWLLCASGAETPGHSSSADSSTCPSTFPRLAKAGGQQPKRQWVPLRHGLQVSLLCIACRSAGVYLHTIYGIGPRSQPELALLCGPDHSTFQNMQPPAVPPYMLYYKLSKTPTQFPAHIAGGTRRESRWLITFVF